MSTEIKHVDSPSEKQSDYKTIVLLTIIVFSLLLIKFWSTTWDDSAITIGFSRNLIRYGDIIPSQYSDRVEGYSTFLWMVINSIFFWLGFGEGQVLNIAKILSSLFAVINILIFSRIVTEKVKNLFYRLLILALYTINATTIASAAFGMETALYATLVLISFVLYKHRKKNLANYVIFSLIASLLILIRHEGAIFMAPFLVVTLFNNPKGFLKEPFIYYWAALFIAYHLWHFLFFGEFLTNPMMAKGYWPYRPIFSTSFDILNYYLMPFVELAVHYCVVITLSVAYFIRFRNQSAKAETKDTDLSLIACIGVIGLFMLLITGDRWGAAQRLSYPSLPFLLLLSFRAIDRISIKDFFKNSKVALILAVFGLTISAEYIYISFHGMEFNLTVNKMLEGAHIATLTQEFLKRDIITFASPDMGALMLFEGDKKRIIDLGLLCDKRLGKYGYSEIEQYVFQEEKPEIILAHDMWLIPLETSGQFFEMYIPAEVITNESMLYLFIREDLLSGLEQKTYKTNAKVSPDLDRVLLEFGKYVIIDLQKSQQ